MPGIVTIYVILIFLKAIGFPVLKEISWGWFILWPLVALILKLVIKILELIIYPVLVFGFIWLMAKLYFFITL